MSSAYSDWVLDKRQDMNLLKGKTLDRVEFWFQDVGEEVATMYFTDGSELEIGASIEFFDYLRKEDAERKSRKSLDVKP